MKPKHTPGPYHVHNDRNGYIGIWSKDHDEIVVQTDSRVNADRLVACFNACEGIDDPNQITDWLTQRNEMLEELKNIVRQAEINPFLSVGMLLEHHSKIRQLLTKVEEE